MKPKGDKRFNEVEATMSVLMRFPEGRLATFTCSFDADATSNYYVVGSKGSLFLENAYEYAGKRKLYIFKDNKITGEKIYPKMDQFAAELDYFSKSILKDRIPEPNAVEGAMDAKIILAIYKSAQTGRVVSLDKPKNPLKYPRSTMKRWFASHQKPKTVEVVSPS